jgi:hypothetical protein
MATNTFFTGTWYENPHPHPLPSMSTKVCPHPLPVGTAYPWAHPLAYHTSTHKVKVTTNKANGSQHYSTLHGDTKFYTNYGSNITLTLSHRTQHPHVKALERVRGSSGHGYEFFCTRQILHIGFNYKPSRKWSICCEQTTDHNGAPLLPVFLTPALPHHHYPRPPPQRQWRLRPPLSQACSMAGLLDLCFDPGIKVAALVHQRFSCSVSLSTPHPAL